MKKSQSGFTLLELLIVGALLVIVFISVSGLLMASLAGSLKTSLWQELRAEGTFTQTQMAYLLRNATGILNDEFDITRQNCDNSTRSYIAFDNPPDSNGENTKSVIFVDPGTPNTLVLRTFDDDQDMIIENPNYPDVTLFSSSVDLHNSPYDPDDTSDITPFTCNQAGEQPYIQIKFALSKQSDALDTIHQDFRRTVLLRNM